MHGQRPVALSPKALDLLILFVSKPGALFTKDDILNTLWRDVAVTDNALTQVVSELRQALGDDPASPRFIETVPRRGYRFVADVTIAAPTGVTAAPAPSSVEGLFGGLHPRVNVRETASVEAYRSFTEGRLKLEMLDPSQVAAAIADFQRALSLDPQYALAHVGLAHAHFWTFQASRVNNRLESGSLMQAIAHARRAIELDADLAEAHSALALFLAGADRSVDAIAAGRRALALEPGNWRHQFRLGIASWGADRLACLEAVLLQFPQFAYAYFGIAMIHVARGNLPSAAEVLRRALAFDAAGAARLERFPGRGLHWLLGMILAAENRTDDARQEFERELASSAPALFAEEFAVDAINGLGCLRLSAGDPAGALDTFQRALERYPDQPRALLGAAAALSRLDRQDESASRLARADAAIDQLRDAGRLTETAMVLAIRHAVAGNPDAALQTLSELLANAAPGSAGWGIPIEPLLFTLHATPGFARIRGALASRAA